MKYFIYDHERINTGYHEFQKGRFDGQTFWKNDSISLSDDLLVSLNLESLLVNVIPNYTTYSEFEIDTKLWNEIMLKAQQIGGEVLDCILEANEWVKNTYLEYDVFTIIGV